MSCLFNSLSHFVGDDSYTIRKNICDYLATNPKLMDELDAATVIMLENGASLAAYIKSMRNTSTWGGAIEIKAFCNLYCKNVFVVNIRDRRGKQTANIIEFIYDEKNVPRKVVKGDKNNVFITWNGGHYEPVRV